MAVDTRTTYTDAAIAKRNIGDMINMIDHTEAPLLSLFGTDNAKKFRMVNWPGRKPEWMEDEMSPRQGTINGALADSDTTFVLDDATMFKAGDILQDDTGSAERIYVVSRDSATNLTVTRGFGGTTAVAILDDAIVHKRTIARMEGADLSTGHTTTMNPPYNYTQILSEAVKVTGSEAVNSEYGVDDQMAYHLSKLIGGANGVGSKFKAGALPILLEQTFFYGVRSAGSASVASAMGGFDQYVSTNIQALSGAALSRKHINTALRDTWDAGGDPDVMIVSSWGKEKTSQLFDGIIRTVRSETKGGHMINTIETDNGDVRVERCKWCPIDTAYIVDSSKAGWMTYRNFSIKDRPEGGDYHIKEVIGEFSFVLCNEKSHAKISGFSTTK